MPGPPKTPTANLCPGHYRTRQREKTEPKPAPGEPAMPDDLTEPAQAVWHAMIELFRRMPGVLTTVDAPGLARYCEDYVDWRRCVDFVRQHGEGVLRQKKKVIVGKIVRDAKGKPLKYENGEPLREPDKEVVVSEHFLYFPQATARMAYGRALERWEKQFGLTAASRPNVQVPESDADLSDDQTRQFFRTVG